MTQQNLVIFDHPLISHKIALLRSVETGAKQFRELVEEITTLMAFEALKDVPTKLVEITTPLERCTQKVVVENSVVIVPVLRAGLGMVNGILRHFFKGVEPHAAGYLLGKLRGVYIIGVDLSRTHYLGHYAVIRDLEHPDEVIKEYSRS